LAGHDGTQASNGRRAGEEPRRPRGRGHDRSWLAVRVAAVTAAVAVIAGGGYGVAQLLTGSGHTLNGAASGNGAAAPAPNIKIKGPIPRMSAGRFNGAPNAGSGSSQRSIPETIAPLVISSGTNYQPTSLGAQASTVLARLNRGAHSSSRPAPVAPPRPPTRSAHPQPTAGSPPPAGHTRPRTTSSPSPPAQAGADPGTPARSPYPRERSAGGRR